MKLNAVHALMKKALQEELFTGAHVVISAGEEILVDCAYGRLGLDDTCDGDEAVTHDTLFDLASVTKVLAVTPAWLLSFQEKPELLDIPIGDTLPEAPADKAAITPRLLLSHSSGLPHWRPYYLTYLGRPVPPRLGEVVSRILDEPLVSTPGSRYLYSDLGFILLHALWETNGKEPLVDFLRRRLYEPLSIVDALTYSPPEKRRIVVTRCGDKPALVNDLNSRSMGGVCGHAGLFGTGRACRGLVLEFLRGYKGRSAVFDTAACRLFLTRRHLPPGSSRALGFDTAAQPEPSCGKAFSPESFGHTGFTGTSVWVDPHNELIVILLTNRVIKGESDLRIRAFRPALHDVAASCVQ